MERLTVEQLHPRLRAIGAQYRPDRSSGAMHVYWAPASRKWVKVVRDGDAVTLTYHATCPCSGKK